MFPEIVSLGPLTIHSYGLAIAMGVFLALVLMGRRARDTGFPPAEKVFDLVFVTLVSGFLGARFFYVLQEWNWYGSHPWDIFKIWEGGLVYYGGVIAAFAGFFLYVRSNRLSFLKTSDFVIPYIALVHAFGRVGCFLKGCCYGKPFSGPWAVKFPFLPAPFHPVQLYEAIFNLALFGFLVACQRRGQVLICDLTVDGRRTSNVKSRLDPLVGFPGAVTSLYLILYSAGRFVLEFFRGDQAPLVFSLTLQQVLSLAFFLAGAGLYGICRRSR